MARTCLTAVGLYPSSNVRATTCSLREPWDTAWATLTAGAAAVCTGEAADVGGIDAEAVEPAGSGPTDWPAEAPAPGGDRDRVLPALESIAEADAEAVELAGSGPMEWPAEAPAPGGDRGRGLPAPAPCADDEESSPRPVSPPTVRFAPGPRATTATPTATASTMAIPASARSGGCRRGPMLMVYLASRGEAGERGATCAPPRRVWTAVPLPVAGDEPPAATNALGGC